MVLHILKNSRNGQINIEFIISVILLALITISAAISIVKLLPAFDTSIGESNLRSRATDLSRILLEEPGVPKNWTSDPKVIGLAYFNNYSAEIVKGELDLTKINYIENSVAYSSLKTNLTLGNDIDFKLTIQNDTNTFLNYFNHTPGKTDKVIMIKKFGAINKTQVNISLLVW